MLFSVVFEFILVFHLLSLILLGSVFDTVHFPDHCCTSSSMPDWLDLHEFSRFVLPFHVSLEEIVQRDEHRSPLAKF